MSLGKRLAQLRKNANLTQSELGDKLNISAQAISKWENDTSEPDIATLRKLADIYNIRISDILESESTPDVEVTDHSSAPQKNGLYDLYLTEVTPNNKVFVIKHLMNMFDMGLAEAKAATESQPYLLSGGEDAEKAEQVAAYFATVGAKVVSEPASGTNPTRDILSLTPPKTPKTKNTMLRRFIVANVTAAVPAIILMALMLAASAGFGDVMLSLYVGISTYTFIFLMWYPTLTRKLMTPMRALSFEGFFGAIGSTILFVCLLPWLLIVALISPINYAFAIKTRVQRMIEDDDEDDIFNDEYIMSL